MKEQDIYEILERDMRDIEIHLTIKQKHFVVDMLKKFYNKGITDSAESAEIQSTHIQGGCMDADDYTIDKQSILKLIIP